MSEDLTDQHWLRWCFRAIRQQAIVWTSVDYDTACRIALLGHDVLKLLGGSYVFAFFPWFFRTEATQKWDKFKPSLITGKDLCIFYSQYNDCWCPGAIQGLSSHDIDLECP